MTRLPVVSGREAARAFGKLGYREDRQTGSHLILRHRDSPHRRLTVPDHKELAKGTLRHAAHEDFDECGATHLPRPTFFAARKVPTKYQRQLTG